MYSSPYRNPPKPTRYKHAGKLERAKSTAAAELAVAVAGDSAEALRQARGSELFTGSGLEGLQVFGCSGFSVFRIALLLLEEGVGWGVLG